MYTYNIYVTRKNQDHWWLAQVLAKDSDNGEVELSLLHPYGPSRSFKHPPSPNVITMALADVLTIVEPRTTGRIYTLTQRQSKAATEMLKHMLRE